MNELNPKLSETEKLRRIILKNKNDYEQSNAKKTTPIRLANVPDSDDECYFWNILYL